MTSAKKQPQINTALINRICSIVAILCAAVSIVILYIANNKMPFKMDDEWYSTNLVTGLPLASITDIWESQVWHYLNWGGRSVAHAILQLVLWAGPIVADVINVAVTILIVSIICKLANVRKLSLWLMTLGFLVILNANWSQNILWQSGVANYLYMTTFILLFLLCYFRTLENSDAKALTGITVWIAPLGLFSGWSNENMGPAVWLGTLCIIIYIKIKENKIYPWMLVGNLFCLLGSVLMITAPGNYVRNIEAADAVAGKGTLWRAFLRGFSVTNGLFFYLLDATVLLLILIFIYCFVLGMKLRRTDYFMLFMAVLSWGAMVLSPHYPDRAAFGTMVLTLIPIMHLISGIWNKREGNELPGLTVSLFVWLGGMFPLCTYICQMLGWLK